MKLSLNGLIGYLQGKGWKINMNANADEDDEEVFEIEEDEDEEENEDRAVAEVKKKKAPVANSQDDLISEEELAGLKRFAQVLAKNGKVLEAIEAGTLEQALSTVPAAAELVKNAASREKAEKDQLIATIKTNSSNIYSDEELGSMSVPVLTKLNAQMNVSYAGLGGGTIQNAEQPLTLPVGLLSQAKEVSNGS